MGRWYEIARYPQWYEKGLTDVSTIYTQKEGYVEVVNSGYKNGLFPLLFTSQLQNAQKNRGSTCPN